MHSYNLKNQSGNVLFLILIAVALFAALSYAVTSSTRSSGGNAKVDTAAAKAASIIQFFTTIDMAVMRMKASGLRNEQISFTYPYKLTNGTDSTPGDNPGCTTDTCRVFKPAGGGVVPINFKTSAAVDPAGWQSNWIAPGYFDFWAFSWPDAGTASNDVVLRIVAIDPTVCQELNKKLGYSSTLAAAGTYPDQGVDPANWDTGSLGCSSNCSQLSGNKTFGFIDGNHCAIFHRIITR